MASTQSTVSSSTEPANLTQKSTPSKQRRFYKNGEQTHTRLRAQLAEERVDKARLKKYGLSVEDFLHMQTIQNRQCALCFRSEDIVGMLVIDHDHTTEKVRALLCVRCNNSLGHIESRGVTWLHNVVGYLRQHTSHLLVALQQLYDTNVVRHAIEELEYAIEYMYQSIDLNAKKASISLLSKELPQYQHTPALKPSNDLIFTQWLLTTKQEFARDEIKLAMLDVRNASAALKYLIAKEPDCSMVTLTYAE